MKQSYRKSGVCSFENNRLCTGRKYDDVDSKDPTENKKCQFTSNWDRQFSLRQHNKELAGACLSTIIGVVEVGGDKMCDSERTPPFCISQSRAQTDQASLLLLYYFRCLRSAFDNSLKLARACLGEYQRQRGFFAEPCRANHLLEQSQF